MYACAMIFHHKHQLIAPVLSFQWLAITHLRHASRWFVHIRFPKHSDGLHKFPRHPRWEANAHHMVRVFHATSKKSWQHFEFFGPPWGYSAYPARFSLDGKRATGHDETMVLKKHRCHVWSPMSGGVPLCLHQVRTCSSIQSILNQERQNSWASAASRLHLSTAPQWRRLRPHLSGRLRCSYFLQQTLTALGAHKHTVDTFFLYTSIALQFWITFIQILFIYNYLPWCQIVSLAVLPWHWFVHRLIRRQLHGCDQSCARNAAGRQAPGSWGRRCANAAHHISRLLPLPPYGTNTHAQHLDLLWPARCKNTHSLRSKSVWIVWMRLLSTCRTVEVIFMFYHIIEYWHCDKHSMSCRLHILPRPAAATSRLTQAPLHPAFQLPAPSRSAAPEWRDRWWKWWDGGFV